MLKNASEIDEYKKIIDQIELNKKLIVALDAFRLFESHLNGERETKHRFLLS